MMSKIIELKQAPVVLVEFPEIVYNLQLLNNIGRPYLNYYTKSVNAHKAYLPDGDYVGLGYLSDLTEEQFAECVDIDYDYGVVIYRNYRTIIIPHYDEQINAKQSFLSLLESENVYTENPHNYILMSTEESFENGKCDKIELQTVKDRWQETESRTFDPMRTIVLIKKKNVK